MISVGAIVPNRPIERFIFGATKANRPNQRIGPTEPLPLLRWLL